MVAYNFKSRFVDAIVAGRKCQTIRSPRFPISSVPAVNVSQVPQRSPLRYPGGKTWLIPHIRAWFERTRSHELLVEPFVGGGIVSLTAVMEGLAARAIMVDLDRDLAAFWQASLKHGETLIARIRGFEPTRANVEAIANAIPTTTLDRGFRTLVLNRSRRGGVLAPGAALTKNGEKGKGVASRWYPETLCKRLAAIGAHKNAISFVEGDGVDQMERLAEQDGTCFFIDPPYTARGGKRAGARLYAHNDVPHHRLFEVMADTRSNFLMTYDCSEEIIACTERFHFHAVVVFMKNGHHASIKELVITRERLFA